MVISVKIKPNARANSIRMENGMITVRVQAPPRDGEANDELVRFLASHLGIPRSAVRIVNGHTSAYKRLELPDNCNSKIDLLAG